MADRETEFVARIGQGIAGMGAAAWDRLAGEHPFVSHAFLSALEQSGSVGPGTGWTPAPVLVEEDGGAIAAAAPAYLKTHSQGEYVFDHGWAEAWERAGGAYYPKLQVAVPFTPVPGPRLLGPFPQQLLAALESVTVRSELSSAHLTFVDEAGAREAGRRGWLIRHGLQYHWSNRGFSDFDEFLGCLTSRKRKAIRKERLAACQGIEVRSLRGADIGPADWDSVWLFYQHTGSRKWGRPYLTRAFFDRIAEAMGERLLLFLACRDGRPIAGALNVIGPDALYGRYWGATEQVRFLHFELSYYRAIDYAIEHRLASVQAGAQGEHKLARGYEPVITESAHFIADPGFRGAIEEFLERERAAVAAELDWLGRELPYRSSASE